MTHKLVQKHLLKGTQEFEIVDDAVNIRIKSPFKEETLTVMLTVLNPEPVIGSSRVEFTSRVNNEALISLYPGKPNAQAFNAFVSLLTQKARDEFNSFAGLKKADSSAMAANSFDEPPEFDEDNEGVAARNKKPLRAEDVANAAALLRQNLDTPEAAPFIAALEQLQTDPNNSQYMDEVLRQFEALGPSQGAVLTYAPYIISVLSDDPYGF